jgi:hypothetical protein
MRGGHQQKRQQKRQRRRFPHCLQRNLPVESCYWRDFVSIVRLSQFWAHMEKGSGKRWFADFELTRSRKTRQGPMLGKSAITLDMEGLGGSGPGVECQSRMLGPCRCSNVQYPSPNRLYHDNSSTSSLQYLALVQKLSFCFT